MKPQSITVSGDPSAVTSTTPATNQWEPASLVVNPTLKASKQNVFIEHWTCPACLSGEMLYGNGITVGWTTTWSHQCDKCGHKASTYEAYPKTIYKDA